MFQFVTVYSQMVVPDPRQPVYPVRLGPHRGGGFHEPLERVARGHLRHLVEDAYVLLNNLLFRARDEMLHVELHLHRHLIISGNVPEHATPRMLEDVREEAKPKARLFQLCSVGARDGELLFADGCARHNGHQERLIAHK